MPSLAFHDVTGFDPRALPGQARFSCPGCSASAEISVRLRPKSVYDFGRNRCSASSEMAVRFRPSYTQTPPPAQQRQSATTTSGGAQGASQAVPQPSQTHATGGESSGARGTTGDSVEADDGWRSIQPLTQPGRDDALPEDATPPPAGQLGSTRADSRSPVLGGSSHPQSDATQPELRSPIRLSSTPQPRATATPETDSVGAAASTRPNDAQERTPTAQCAQCGIATCLAIGTPQAMKTPPPSRKESTVQAADERRQVAPTRAGTQQASTTSARAAPNPSQPAIPAMSQPKPPGQARRCRRQAPTMTSTNTCRPSRAIIKRRTRIGRCRTGSRRRRAPQPGR